MLIHVAFEALLLNILIIVSFTTSATRFPLIHRDNYNLHSSSHHNNSGNGFEAQMKHDAMRVASLTHRLAANESDHLEIDLEYLSQYFAEVGVGTPSQIQTLFIDTGSDIMWVQCQPCDSACYQQFDLVFDPNNSTSFTDVGCDDLACYKVEESRRGCDHQGSRCTYDIMYEDGSETYGTLAIENITIGNTTVPNILIGCSHKAQGLLTEIQADGILGLGRGSLSVVSQSGGLIGGMFSYCLGNSDTGSGWLEFGRTNVPGDSIIEWARLIYSIQNPTYYYIDLVGFLVGGEVLDIPGDTFQLNEQTGEGGVILDTGTVVTQLVKVAYVALRDKFKEKMGKYALVDGGVPIFDTCYNLGGDDINNGQVPTVSYNLSSQGYVPANIILEASNVLYQVDYKTSTYCLAFAPSESLSIIGNLQQQGIQIIIDASGGYVGFGSGPC